MDETIAKSFEVSTDRLLHVTSTILTGTPISRNRIRSQFSINSSLLFFVRL